MRIRNGVVSAILLVCFSAVSRGQAPGERASAFDARWTAWLGCWQSDATHDAALTCVIPDSRSSGVQMLSVVNGRIVARRTLEADARRHVMNDQGCDGTRIAQWAAKATRVYARADYACGATNGVSSDLLTLTTGGEWLEVENVRAGEGSLERVNHWHDAGLPSGVPAEIVSAIAGRQLAISTARAAVVAPGTINDVLEALRHVDSSAVRTWIVESGQHFSLSGEQASELIRANVPRSVLQAVVGWTQNPQQNASVDEARAASDAYLSSGPVSGFYPVVVTYARPVIVARRYCEWSWCEYAQPYQPYRYGYGYSIPWDRGYRNTNALHVVPAHQEPVGIRMQAPAAPSWGPVTHSPAGYAPRGGGRRP
jgi:hypothetical protein